MAQAMQTKLSLKVCVGKVTYVYFGYRLLIIKNKK